MLFSKHIVWVIHITAWLFYILSPFLILPNAIIERGFNGGFLLSKLFEDILVIVFFYANYLYFTPQLLRTGQTKRFFLILFLCFFGLCLVSIFIVQSFIKPELPIPNFGLMPPKGNFPVAMPNPMLAQLFRQIPTFIFATLISSLLVIIQDRLALKEQKQQILLEKIASELEVLKLQISPHFLFNTLNNIRWLARQKSDKTEETIVKLSSMLRYILYETKAEKVPLQNEIKNLEDYIALQKIRLTDLTTVFFRIGANNYHLIEPLLLIPFVENAFKYGVHNQYESTIDISIFTEKNNLYFTSQNTIFEDIQKTSDKISGIGISNVQRRLKMYYPGKHKLEISEAKGTYLVNLEITF